MLVLLFFILLNVQASDKNPNTDLSINTNTNSEINRNINADADYYMRKIAIVISHLNTKNLKEADITNQVDIANIKSNNNFTRGYLC